MTAAPPMHPNSPPIGDRDAEHLRLLAIFYYVWAGLIAFGTFCPGSIYLIMGIVMLVNPEAMKDSNTGEPVPAFVGWIVIAAAVFVFVLGVAMAGLALYTGRCLSRHVHRTFCFVMAAIACLGIPLGTILGIFTIVVLSRDSVVAKFERNRLPV